jgi:MoaA/NifB/PqqE/SkfB family radical SAM enzyme
MSELIGSFLSDSSRGSSLLTPKWQEELVRSGLDEFRCSIDGAQPETYAHIRGWVSLSRLPGQEMVASARRRGI